MKVIKEEMDHFEDKFAKTYENFLSKRFQPYPVPYPYPTWAKKIRVSPASQHCFYLYLWVNGLLAQGADSHRPFLYAREGR